VEILRSSAFALFRLSGLAFLWRRVIQRTRVTILCFHDPAPSSLAAYVQTLRKHYRLISLEDFLDWHRGGRASIPSYALVITLDDGHAGNYGLLDVVNTQSVPISIFLCSGIVGTCRHFWWSAVTSERERAHLKSLPNHERLARLESTWGHMLQNEYAQPEALSTQHIQAMASGGIDFQAHTRFHPILPKCTDQQAKDEIFGCRAELQERLGKAVNAFAYPNGEYSDREIALVQEAGFHCALTLDAGCNDRSTDPFRLKRIIMDDDVSNTELLVRASGVWDATKRLFGKKPPFGYRSQ
jgi:poly-beta-1,6-N-acetyl-D-glucosamine N-deacetylase